MNPPLSSADAYRQAGVDLQKADDLVAIAKAAAKKTDTPLIQTGIGGFSGAFEIPAGYQHPVLLTGCDGVGTKLKIAIEAGRHDTVGIDLVAMSVNDVLVNGGKPLVFLDYHASGALDLKQLEQVLTGIAEGCQQAGCALVGGETAEMPGFYPKGEYDLAGFCVGVAEKANLYPKADQIQHGDVIIGLTSSGLHSNGYSLARKVLFMDHQLPLSHKPAELGGTLAETLLTPTRIYVEPVLNLLQQHPAAIRAMAHITGGGFYDNLPRVLPKNFSAQLDASTWQPHQPAIFKYLQQLGQLDNPSMWHTFNCGIGYVLVCDPRQADAVLTFLNTQNDFKALAIGHIQKTPGACEVRIS